MYQQLTLPNGARILTQEVPGARSAAFGFFVGAGSRHENPADNGAAHFIEHMLFKGTNTRSSVRLARDMDAIGGQFNAYTTKEHTCFYGPPWTGTWSWVWTFWRIWCSAPASIRRMWSWSGGSSWRKSACTRTPPRIWCPSGWPRRCTRAPHWPGPSWAGRPPWPP